MDADSLGDLCRVHFRVKAPVKLGQVIGLSGSSYALGSFNRLQVLSLVTTPEAYPIWYTVTPVVIPRGEVVRYKYCVLEAGVVKAFEKIDQPRIVVTEELDNIVEDELSLQSLENSNQDSEMQLFDEIVRMKRRGSEHDRLFDLSILSHGQRLFLVCYHLPIEVHRSSDSNALFTVNWTDSLIAKSRDSIANDARTQWMGTVSVGHLKLVEGEMEALTEILQKMDCIPVFLDDEVAYDAYKGFCKQIMWPIFHNVDQIDQIHAAWNLPSGYGEAKSGAADGLVTKTNISHVSSSRERWAHEGSKANSETWTKQQGLDKESSTATEKVVEWNKNEKKYHAAYQRMNEMFYETLQKHIHENDVVWVHDYHLMLLPKLLRGTPLPLASNRKDKEQFTQSIDCKIVFFLHIPFPTSQIFRTLPNANELLHSMTCADVVGFHAFDHTRHFLNAIKRMLGIRSYTRPGGLLTVMVQDREVIVTMSHVSIEPDAIDKLLIDPETLRKASEIREKYKGRRIIVGVDTCQRLNGVAHKLAAFDRFLADYSGMYDNEQDSFTTYEVNFILR